MLKKSLALPQDRENIKELTITILGNANSGKSSLVGILANPIFSQVADTILTSFGAELKDTPEVVPSEILDDGNGKSRNPVLQFIHEQKTGRTSSISYNYLVLNKGYKVLSFVDLAGHEAYLKTTIRGVTSSYPDFGFICIEKSITYITKEHIQLLYILGIPFGIIMSKTDLIPKDKIQDNLKKIFRLLKSINLKPYIIKSQSDLALANTGSVCPVFLMSNKTGAGFDKLIPFVNTIEKKPTKIIPNAFVIDSIYTVPGFGLIVSGMSGIEIEKGAELVLGPFSNGQDFDFIKVKVRTMHDDYRNFIDILKPGSRGCLCIKMDAAYKKKLRSGLVLAYKQENVAPVQKFRARIHIFQGTLCTITPGYSAFINTGIVKGCVKFNTVYSDDDEAAKQQKCIRAGNTTIAELEFLKNAYCLTPGEIFIFREGRTIGFGEIL